MRRSKCSSDWGAEGRRARGDVPVNRILRSIARPIVRALAPALFPVYQCLHRWLLTPLNCRRNAGRNVRRLEIGPGPQRIPGFETLNIRAGLQVDYVADAARCLPFPDESFDLIYASHVIEHVPWYELQGIVCEWVRVLKPKGSLELWTPNGLEIAKSFVAAETGSASNIALDGWYKFNPEQDPCVWANGRIFSYGNGDGRKDSPNWHMAIFSPRYLQLLMERAGLIDVELMNRSQVRGHDHGWINLGMRGCRP